MSREDLATKRLSLDKLLANRQWLLCNDPFPHVVAQNVFVEPLFRELSQGFGDILEGRGLETWRSARFSRNMPRYDAAAVNFEPQMGWPFNIFVSRSFHDLLGTLFSVDASLHVSGGLHHHARGSANGVVHNDLNPGWFGEHANDDGIIVQCSKFCDYQTGKLHAPGASHETVRAIAMIYYLNNSAWENGDGGETGLYRRGTDAVELSAVAVTPRNNSLIAFECTPTSFHSFKSNVRHPRNSVNLWLHRSKQSAIDRFGEQSIVVWN